MLTGKNKISIASVIEIQGILEEKEDLGFLSSCFNVIVHRFKK